MPEHRRKEILIVVDWFFPGYKAGGPIQSTLNLAFALKDKYRIKVLTTDTDHGETLPYPDVESGKWIRNIDPDIECFYMRKATLTLDEIKNLVIQENADFVYLNHMFSPKYVIYPLWLKYLGKLKSNVIVSPRGALYESALKVKPWKKYPFLSLLKMLGVKSHVTFHATNEREKQAINHFFPDSKIVVADNLPKSMQSSYEGIQKRSGSLKCIFVARIVPIKNLLFLLEIIGKLKAELELTIVGPDEDKNYWNQCREKIASFDSDITVNYLGPKDNRELGAIIRQHHLFILPTEGENFGHSIFEAILSGRPVLISDQTPWHNLKQQKIGWDLPLSDKTKFVESMNEAVEWDQEEFDSHARASWNYGASFIADKKRIEAYELLFS